MPHPHLIRWTQHAELRASIYSIPRGEVEQLVLGHHGDRVANHRSHVAAWRLVRIGMTVVYDHPDGADWLTAVVVTVWRNR